MGAVSRRLSGGSAARPASVEAAHDIPVGSHPHDRFAPRAQAGCRTVATPSMSSAAAVQTAWRRSRRAPPQRRPLQQPAPAWRACLPSPPTWARCRPSRSRRSHSRCSRRSRWRHCWRRLPGWPSRSLPRMLRCWPPLAFGPRGRRQKRRHSQQPPAQQHPLPAATAPLRIAILSRPAHCCARHRTPRAAARGWHPCHQLRARQAAEAAAPPGLRLCLQWPARRQAAPPQRAPPAAGPAAASGRQRLCSRRGGPTRSWRYAPRRSGWPAAPAAAPPVAQMWPAQPQQQRWTQRRRPHAIPQPAWASWSRLWRDPCWPSRRAGRLHQCRRVHGSAACGWRTS